MKKLSKIKDESEFEYENRIVVFIDILGFGSIIKSSSLAKSFYNVKTLGKIFSIISEKFNLENQNWETSQTKSATHFSDTIVISYKNEEIADVISAIVDIQHCIAELIKLKILVRGAVTEGLLIHNDNMLFGPALVEAYELEKDTAKNPRIILKSKLVEKFFEGNISAKIAPMVEFQLKDLILKDEDGYYFIDYFLNVGLLRIIQSNSSSARDNYYSDYYVYLKSLMDLIKENVLNKDPKIFEKYKWMKEKYNSTLYRFKDPNVYKIIKRAVEPNQLTKIRKLKKIQ